jgi:hypothetical protein
MAPSNQTQQKINLPLTINKNMLGSNSKLHALINKSQAISLNNVLNGSANKPLDEEGHQSKVSSLPITSPASLPITGIKTTNSITPMVNTVINTIKPSCNLPSPVNTAQQTGKKGQNVTNHSQQQITPVINKDNPSKTLNLVVDENFLSENSIAELNEFILPDTRIFASLLNKTGQQPASSKVSNNKRNLDLTYKTAMIGQTEHVILDNQNNLSDYKGNLVQLQNLACLIANQLKKPVTIPAFMLIEQDNIEEIKTLFNEKNVNPIVIETQMPNNNENKSLNTHKHIQSNKAMLNSGTAHSSEKNNQQSLNEALIKPNAVPSYIKPDNSVIVKRLSEPIEEQNSKRIILPCNTSNTNQKVMEFVYPQVANSSLINSTKQNSEAQIKQCNDELSNFQINSFHQEKQDLMNSQATKTKSIDYINLEQDDLNFDSFDANLFINFTEQLIS